MALMVLQEGEDPLVSTAGGIAVRVAVAVVDRTLEHTVFPAVVEVCVVPVPGGITVRKYKGLVGVHRLRTNLVELAGVPVELHEDTGEVDGILGVQAVAAIRASRAESNVGLVVGRVDVLAVPAAGEVDLRADAGRALLLGKAGVLGGLAVEVEAEEVDGQLRGARSVVGPQGGVSTEHAEVRRERRRGSSLVVKEVVDDGATVQAREASIGPLEVKKRGPVVGLVLFDWDGATLAFAHVLGGGSEAEVAPAEDDVGVPRYLARVDDRIDTLLGNRIGPHEPVGVGRCTHA